MSASRKAGNMKVVLFTVLCLLIVGLGAGAYMVLSSGTPKHSVKTEKEQQNTPIKPQVVSIQSPEIPMQSSEDTIKQGIKIAGMEVGGLTKAQALELLKENGNDLLNNIKVSFKVADKQFDYTAEDLGIYFDAENSLNEALKSLQMQADAPADYKAIYALDTAFAREKLSVDTSAMNIAPVDATVEFTPKEAEIFKYTPEADGQSVQLENLVALIEAQVKTGNFEVLDAPVDTVPAAVKIDDLKLRTLPIVFSFNKETNKWEPGFTSYFKRSNENGKNRVFNINKLSGILNGTVLQPGEELSLNKKAGPRTTENGWRKAHGIVDGRYEDQPGGGVCQVSGTLYNAVIRAELNITARQHHSWPSTYLPQGLDATISTGGPDLKFKNPYDAPIYITSICDTKKKSLTITIYGKPLSHGLYVDFTSKKTGSIPQPEPKTIYQSTDLEGDPIAYGASVVYPGHTGQIWKVYKQWKDAAGNVIKTEEFGTEKYLAFGKRIVTNNDPKATAAPAEPSSSPFE